MQELIQSACLLFRQHPPMAHGEISKEVSSVHGSKIKRKWFDVFCTPQTHISCGFGTGGVFLCAFAMRSLAVSFLLNYLKNN